MITLLLLLWLLVGLAVAIAFGAAAWRMRRDRGRTAVVLPFRRRAPLKNPF